MAVLATAISACATPDPADRDDRPFAPDYLGAEAAALDGELVQIKVRMGGARDARDVADYADCAMAGYAEARGFAFSRHLRTTTQERAGVWAADAIYTMSPTIPEGGRTIDVEALLGACAVNGIPQL